VLDLLEQKEGLGAQDLGQSIQGERGRLGKLANPGLLGVEDKDRGLEARQDRPNPRRLSRLPRPHHQLRTARTQLEPAVALDERFRQGGGEQGALVPRPVQPRIVDTKRRQECRIHTG
jgi:hypothetical protein